MLITVLIAVIACTFLVIGGALLAEGEGLCAVLLAVGILCVVILTQKLLQYQVEAEVSKRIQQRTELVEKPSDVQRETQ